MMAQQKPAVEVLTAGISKTKKRGTRKKAKSSSGSKNDEVERKAENAYPSIVPTSVEHPSQPQEQQQQQQQQQEYTTTQQNQEQQQEVISAGRISDLMTKQKQEPYSDDGVVKDEVMTSLPESRTEKSSMSDILWLAICFFGIMGSFIAYGILLEYTTSGGRKLHELSFLFVTSLFYTITGAIGSHVRGEEPTTIPPARFAVLGLTSMGSTFCSVRSLRYVIFPIQVLAKSCKPVPVMIMGAFMGKKYSWQKYVNVMLIVSGVALFMSGGSSKNKSGGESSGAGEQLIGIILLFISLCFDGGTGAYEDKLMSVHSVGPFDLMYNIQLGKTILAFLGLLIFNEMHLFIKMCGEMGFLLVALGLSGALGQIFIFVTISKFGALTCSIIGLARKVTTLVASIYIYGHHLNSTQWFGLFVCVGSMVMNFMNKKGGKKGDGHDHGRGDKREKGAKISGANREETVSMLDAVDGSKDSSGGDVELGSLTRK